MEEIDEIDEEQPEQKSQKKRKKEPKQQVAKSSSIADQAEEFRYGKQVIVFFEGLNLVC